VFGKINPGNSSVDPKRLGGKGWPLIIAAPGHSFLREQLLSAHVK
jgi:hypothetical protein